MGYLVDKNKNYNHISYMEYDIDGYSFMPNATSQKHIRVTKVTLFKEEMVKNLVINRFEQKFNKLMNLAFNIISDEESDEGDCMIVLDEIDRLKAVLDIKMKKDLKNEEYKEYIDKLYYLKTQVEGTIISKSYSEVEEYTESKGRSR